MFPLVFFHALSLVCSMTCQGSGQEPAIAPARSSEGYAIPDAPTVPSGAPSPELAADLEAFVRAFEGEGLTPDVVRAVARHADARTAWLLADLLRFGRTGDVSEALVTAIEGVAGVELPVSEWSAAWKTSLDFLIAWDLPALPGYVARKARVYTAIEPAWRGFFDARGSVDWRLVTWGGVFPDDRPLGVVDGCPRGCIPALDDPQVTDADGGAWCPDDAEVFGVTIAGESRAYPKHQMETHELVLDTLGGRRIGLPYCTLCASAQAYFLDRLPEGVPTPVLRTSGLLSRSNKLMYDQVTHSLIDTFTGAALSGPLRERGVRLQQTSVVATTWGAWKAAHPETTLVSEDGGIGYVYARDPLGGRDDNGPIFPVGAVDPRLAAQTRVVGAIRNGELAVAFPVREALDALARGEVVEHAGVRLARSGGGLLARDEADNPLATHASFWFAWSQFHEPTKLWRAPATSSDQE